MGAPKHNLFALGNNGGRPRLYKDANEFENKVNEYFEFCIENKMELAISGLSQYLGFCDRKSFYDYGKREEFLHIIKRAQQAIELSYELDLRTFKFGGSIFALKNISKEYWKDKTEQEVQQTINNVQATFGTAVSTPHQPTEDTQ